VTVGEGVVNIAERSWTTDKNTWAIFAGKKNKGRMAQTGVKNSTEIIETKARPAKSR